jgi:ribulose-5-phosphate 4-epimerase/fuculose-1-phosphate aldolase
MDTELVPAAGDVGLLEAKAEFAAAFRAASLHGFNEGVDNHFSLMVPGAEDRFWLNPFGPDWSELRASELLTVSRDGDLVEGDGAWERSAFVIHRAVHLARPRARCVFHTHMPYATAVSMTETGLDTRASQNAMLFHGRIARVPFGGIAHDADQGSDIAAAVGADTAVVFLDNHGVLVIGASVADAWHMLYFLERACQTQVLARSTGDPLIRVPEAVAQQTAERWASSAQAEALFAAVRRELDRWLPGYDG